MTGKVKVVGANKAAKKLNGNEYPDSVLYSDEWGILILILKGRRYIISNQRIFIESECIRVAGAITDDISFVGRVELEFFPQSS